MSENTDDLPDLFDLVISDTKSLIEMMDTLSSNLRRALALYDKSDPLNPELDQILEKQNKLIRRRLTALVIENTQMREMPDDAEVYLLRAFKAQLDVMLMAINTEASKQAEQRKGSQGTP